MWDIFWVHNIHYFSFHSSSCLYDGIIQMVKSIAIPKFVVNNVELKTVENKTCLCVFVTDSLTDDVDMERQRKYIYSTGNILDGLNFAQMMSKQFFSKRQSPSIQVSVNISFNQILTINNLELLKIDDISIL